jgi:hypothetical protein
MNSFTPKAKIKYIALKSAELNQQSEKLSQDIKYLNLRVG